MNDSCQAGFCYELSLISEYYYNNANRPIE